MYLEKINSPEDVKKLSIDEMKDLSTEIREVLLKKLSEHGGHIGPNLGIVELTIALHYVFNSPKDKIVYDVSHQSYIHKMLTGRKEAFINSEKYDEVSGYSNPEESEHDFFNIGHTSTSISLACGLAKARDVKDETDNVIAIIGDGSLSGGEAYEGLNNAAETGTNMIIIVNDNDMSIAENHGGLYKNLKELRDTEGKSECNFFKAMGLDYHYVKDGHDLEQLIGVFNKVKDTKQPVVVHIHTVKGKGFKFAEKNKEQWHWGMPFVLETGASKVSMGSAENYGNLTGEYLLDYMKRDPKVVAITSGTPAVFGFWKERRNEAGRQFVDVGIAEEHAVALASGIAANGGNPVYGVYSTFLQRTYDQLSQDLCINNNPAVLLVFAASVYGMNDVTHLGLYDIGMMSNIPNMVYLAPTCKEEYFAMLKWAMIQKDHPVAIRVPAMGVIESGVVDNTDYSKLNKYEVTKAGKDVAVIALGDFYQLGQSVTEKLSQENGINATLINPKYITGIDEELLEGLKKEHKLVITLEDGILDGGFGEKIARYYGASDMKVLNYGIKKELLDRYVPDELMKKNRLTDVQIVEDIMNIIK
ncbi:1-deoxy-D-xylulose-5-phosphate synthase [Clostridium acetobutylicum]|uniref:1-deoxy-D-xylulose-5-phosphate synthase n=1 Tax=Clostridium acetobutylicum (strain ATCC 824 / DSM 792 / JCM 1419 / IAM 19013 / LMG 5710 / NBRC 13948 / NRRL B-527 / VKM B-1787 / 2291 / W) TaxID=272562 RepID=Q97TJ5_CLOAB|nr:MULTISPECIES: 1-deoxy-D-xylulose-5-phosphate synthase [Clostridium]AAK76851.1 1-deoxyxylulose-5-phosphate synthase, dehydrogenase [Clostridium acetobutylicum ATCC 824]ADZ22888.1 1-deoxy-D-xylulose-5-phosphate synthase [Clostridium acetobutylicum EA 2018]AEI34847.1 1-deoxy-D-xylulose-5-phosphate synthase [Clostridium acetobutylicum DSM 1731]AWV82393.1 1-deoxy-D-xylulose-5-phosphate synthase [Clostridium acetobutylicum]MBC2395763.1 1-deoxy-D-xylulose-5-phosphate synthase [Clostridium acetobut